MKSAKDQFTRKLTLFIFAIFISIALVACDDGPNTSTQIRTDAYAFNTLTDTQDVNCSLTKGQTEIKQQGKNGEKTITEIVTSQDSKEISRVKISEFVTIKPVDQILRIGGMEKSTEVVNEEIPFIEKRQPNSSIPCGEERIMQEGVNGLKAVAYETIIKCGTPDGARKIVGITLLTPPMDKIIGVGPTCPPLPPPPDDNCDPNYVECIPPYPPDLDCADIGFSVQSIGSDPHGLDADGDGIGCESYGY